LLVKDGDGVGRLANDLRRSVANLERLDARVGEVPLMPKDKLLSSLDIVNVVQ
jgi:hypothetical protein